MDKPTYKLVGQPCGQHGQYTFYKALRISGERERVLAIGDFFFVRIWQDSELISIGELQLLWTDRVADQTLVSLRLYFLPENTPDGRNAHGEHEVLAINEKVVVRADDLLSWVCDGAAWTWGFRAIWRGACAPPAENKPTSPLHHTKLDFSDVEKEKNAITVDPESPGVVVFSYARYCRYRALASRLEGIQAAWLRDALVAALGGYSAPTKNTRILYCKDTFEYPELEGHEFVCNQLAPRLKGRPRGRRRRRARSSSPLRDSGSDQERTPRRLSLRNGPYKSEDEYEDEKTKDRTEDRTEDHKAEDKTFLKTLKQFYKGRNETFKVTHGLKDSMSLRLLYKGVNTLGGYAAVCRRRAWRALRPDADPQDTRTKYERYLLPYENHERRNGSRENGRKDTKTDHIDTIEVPESPTRDVTELTDKLPPLPVNIKIDTYDPSNLLALNTETGETEILDVKEKSEKKDVKISVKPVAELLDFSKDLKEKKEFLSDLSQKYQMGGEAKSVTAETPLRALSAVSDKYTANGHAAVEQKSASRAATTSSLRSVRVKGSRALGDANAPSLRPDSASSSPPAPAPALTNFGINYPPAPDDDDEIVEVPYKPKTPEIIDLDEYPESPQAVKKKKLEILKERGLEVTPIPTNTPWVQAPVLGLNPGLQHQILSQAQLFQMYNMVPYPNGVQSSQPPKVIQGKSIFGTSGPEKTVYGNPKDPFMPPPHILQGTPIKPTRTVQSQQPTPPDLLDLSNKTQKPAVEIVRVPTVPSPSTPQNLAKNYTLVDGKAVVGSNLEITLVNAKPSQTSQTKSRIPQKRSSNGKFVSSKTPTPPKKEMTSPKPKTSLIVPSYQVREETPPSSSFKTQPNLAQMMELQAKTQPNLTPFMDPLYMGALYSSLAGQMDQRQLAYYRDLMANQFRSYSGLLNMTNTPTTKN